uniref:Uncharacterized protein n=1 Tax=Anguilla anguilla TaxID=7936 RepID=A0A0E9WYM7_ANGAN
MHTALHISLMYKPPCIYVEIISSRNSTAGARFHRLAHTASVFICICSALRSRGSHDNRTSHFYHYPVVC